MPVKQKIRHTADHTTSIVCGKVVNDFLAPVVTISLYFSIIQYTIQCTMKYVKYELEMEKLEFKVLKGFMFHNIRKILRNRIISEREMAGS